MAFCLAAGQEAEAQNTVPNIGRADGMRPAAKLMLQVNVVPVPAAAVA